MLFSKGRVRNLNSVIFERSVHRGKIENIFGDTLCCFGVFIPTTHVDLRRDSYVIWDAEYEYANKNDQEIAAKPANDSKYRPSTV